MPEPFSSKTKVHSSEQLYQFRKAWYFNDLETCKKVITATSPKECKNVARDNMVKGFDTDVWKQPDGPAVHAMQEVLVRKFTLDSPLWTELNEAPRILVEASPTDFFGEVGGLRMIF